jgi:hypothetical protein
MIRLILAFMLVFGFFFFGLQAWRNLSGMEKWALTKYAGYSILCAVLTTALLTLLVVLF